VCATGGKEIDLKTLAVLLLVAGICLAFDPDAGPMGGTLHARIHQGTDDYSITLTSENDVSLSWAGSLRGCDYADTYGELLVTDYNADSIFSVDPTNGDKSPGLACPAGVPQVLGICHYQTTGGNYFYINDWQNGTDVYEYYTGSGSWSLAFANPVVEPRGMDMDEDNCIWHIDADSHMLYYHDLTGSVIDSWTLSELPSGFACGVSCFPYDGDLGIIVGGYYFDDFYFYLYDGSDLEYMGMAGTPQSASSSYGVSYSEDTDSFYWIYTSGGYRLCEFTADIEEALVPTTWGQIKAGL
jgi:hypothetical protein